MTAPDAGATPWQKYICDACGYVYDEALGDPDSGLAPGTRFADIPEDWVCPLCGVTKADFSPYQPVCLETLKAQARDGAGPWPANCQASSVVIVGAGRAGWTLAERLRAQDAALPITLVSACSGDLYDKPLLSVALARGIAPQQLVKESGRDAARRLDVRLLAHTHAIRIDAARQRLRTTRGNLAYSHLVLAHGAQAGLPLPLSAANCWRINHLDDYRKLRAALQTGPQQVAIVGAGLIGSELANDLALGGHQLTLLDSQPEPLARWRDQGAGAQLLQAWQALPIRFVGGIELAGLQRIDADERPRYRLSTACGQQFEADQVIAATGLQTPSRLAQGAALDWDCGIVVDPQTMGSSQPGIYALGDCASVAGTVSRFIEPISRQASTLAAAICGCPPLRYESRPVVVRVKTSSCPLTLQGGTD